MSDRLMLASVTTYADAERSVIQDLVAAGARGITVHDSATAVPTNDQAGWGLARTIRIDSLCDAVAAARARNLLSEQQRSGSVIMFWIEELSVVSAPEAPRRSPAPAFRDAVGGLELAGAEG